MSDNCKHPTCFDSPHCRREKKPRKIYKLRRFSVKRQKVNKDYSKESKEFILKHPFCEINIPGVCNRVAEGIHHVKGKSTIKLLMDKKFWKRSCNACNLWIEENSKKAKELGHKKSKHDVNKQAKLP